VPKVKISYSDGLPPIEVSIIKAASAACHWHDQIEVIWVISGALELTESHLSYRLVAGDVFVVNYNEAHRFAAGPDCVIALAHFDHRYFAKDIPHLKEISFAHYCFSRSENPDAALENCRRFLATLYRLLHRERRDAGLAGKLETMMSFFVKLLVDTFQYRYYIKQEGVYRNTLDRSPGLSPEQLRRMQRLTFYIHNNCNESLTLDSVAETEFYSRFTISHFIKKAFGLSFQETVCLSRVVMAERILIDTDFGLDEIATLVGFSNRSQFCDQFKKWHGLPPSLYRKQNKAGAPGNLDIAFPLEEEEIAALLAPYL